MNDSQILSSSRLPWLLTLTAALLLSGAGGWYLYRASLPSTMKLEFVAVVGDQPLLQNQLLYPNPGGEGTFKIRDFQFYVANISLVSDKNEYLEPASYHLLRFDNDDKLHSIVLDNVPRAHYSRIKFSLGVDPVANRSIAAIGDLDANGRMAWNWEVGYKFLLFEGGLQSGGVLRPLVYHIGFDENYQPLAFDLDPSGPTELQFQVDIMKLFSGRSIIDMEQLSSVKFDRVDAKLIADNYADMISLCAPEYGSC